MRRLVGPTDPSAFDNPSGALVYPYLVAEQYATVFDFGCGCGRVARQLMQQVARPQRYLGIDHHRGMIEWCLENLAGRAPGFEFRHHDVYDMAFNPGSGKRWWRWGSSVRPPRTRPFPAEDHAFTLVNAWSVFTHTLEDAAEYYLRECARILVSNGVLHSTWFLFDKSGFPMMQEFQNALFINDVDPINAVIFDKTWLCTTASAVGLVITRVVPPTVRGFQWLVLMEPERPGLSHVDFPTDEAAVGIVRASLGGEQRQTGAGGGQVQQAGLGVVEFPGE
jgi:SAM-dependent methyltransferase